MRGVVFLTRAVKKIDKKELKDASALLKRSWLTFAAPCPCQVFDLSLSSFEYPWTSLTHTLKARHTHANKQINNANRTECYIWATIIRVAWALCSMLLFRFSFFFPRIHWPFLVVLARCPKKSTEKTREREKEGQSHTFFILFGDTHSVALFCVHCRCLA